VPTYSYQCDSCGNEFDLKQSFSAEPRHECPVCSHIARRRFHAPPVIYKGSGFYTTDYARKSDSKSESRSETKSESPSGISPSSGSSKSDSKSSSDSSTSASASAASPSSTSSSKSGD
jgi:putative FmdB family regulatory protein